MENDNKVKMEKQLLTDDELDMVSGGVDMGYKVYYCNNCKENFAIPSFMCRSANMIKCVKCEQQDYTPVSNM